jgi:hypothetical protein
VFETEISWGGVKNLTSTGSWCARIRFINESNTPMTADAGCYFSFSEEKLSVNKTSTNYVEQNKLTSVN